jgi:plasmid stabilization system protein ParE
MQEQVDREAAQWRSVEWAGRAKSDLRLAVESIRRDSPRSAKAFLSRAFETTGPSSTFAERGHVVPELNDPEVRQVPCHRG